MSNQLLEWVNLQNILILGGVSLGIYLLFKGRFLRYIPNNYVGIVEKLFSTRGSVTKGLIALGGEAGYQPWVLRGGWHLMKPFIYRIHRVPLVTIPQGTIGYVYSRDGEALNAEQTLASNETANNFESVGHFLKNGGQRGPQRKILREGTYAINLSQFVVISKSNVFFHKINEQDLHIFNEMFDSIDKRNGFEPVVIKDHDDLLGVVTVHDGPSLSEGEIIAPIVGNVAGEPELFHNNFQNPQNFIRAGGRRGRQLQVLVEGTYYLNRLFATVELIPKTIVDVGQVGVVVSYTGQAGTDLSGSEYKHGELVSRGMRGVWEMPLLPGKYAFNTYAGRVVMAPTTNFILKWKKSESGAHRYDENLSEVSLITRDAFEPSLPLSVVVHIDYKKAPLVIQRFGDIKRLVEQTLDPMVSSYFKNIGQTRTLIDLLQDRSQIQIDSSADMKHKFAHYNLELEEVLIGTPTASANSPIDQILAQLRSRQIAEEQIQTYTQQQKAADQERTLREAEAKAKQQQLLTESAISIEVQANEGKAEYQRALQQAAQIRALAEAEAEKAARVGIAQAMAIEEQVKAYGGPQFQVMQQVMNRFSEAIEKSKIDIVPKVVMGGNGESGNSNVFESLMAMILAEKAGVRLTPEKTDPFAQSLKDEIRGKLKVENSSTHLS